MSTIFRSADPHGEAYNRPVETFKGCKLAGRSAGMRFEEIVWEALELLSGKITQSNVKIDIQNDLPKVCACRNKLLTVLQNLIENAVKYIGPQTEPRIKIGSRNDGEEVVFFVEDNGIRLDLESVQDLRLVCKVG